MLAGRVNFSHAGCGRVGLLEGFEDRVRGDVRLLAAVLRLALAVLHRFPPPRLVLVVGVIFLVLNPEALSLFHEGTLFTLVQ